MVRLLVAAIGVAGAHVASAWDPSLLSNCKTCTADTQPFCMDLLEAANADSSTYDSEFEDDVTCDELEFAFECVVLENSVYPDGYLDYYFSISGNTVSDCETYADYYDTKQCNTYCVSSGGDVQEGAMEFFCEQCNEDTVADCYYYLGYSNQDATMSCDSKQLALDCVMRNFTAYPDGYIAWMASQRNDVSCEEIAESYSTDDCALRCTDCPATCLSSTCDELIATSDYTCAHLESLSCDCGGCACNSLAPTPAPGPDDGWIVQADTKCGRGGGLGENELAIGTDGNYYDIVDHETVFVSDCKATCEGYAGCGGFSLEMGTQTECWYISDTRLYVDTAPGEYCYTYRFNATSVDVAAEVAKCSQCDSDVSYSDCVQLVDNAFDLSWNQEYTGNFCNDLQTALDCITTPTTTYPDGYLVDSIGVSCSDYLDDTNTGLCSPQCSNTTSSSDTSIEWCTTCSAATADKCFAYLQAAVLDVSTSCSDFATALDCLDNQDYWTVNDLQCTQFLSAIDSSCGLTCPDVCQATCNYRSCDEIIALTDVVTCAQMENAWGCDCSACSCDSSPALLNSMGYQAVVGTSCYSQVVGSDTNRVDLESTGGTSYVNSATVDECATYCGDNPLVCGGFSYNIGTQQCIFVQNASRLGSDKGEFLCFQNTGSPITTTTLPQYAAVTDATSISDSAIPIGASIGAVVVVGVIVGIVIWKVNDRKKQEALGFSPQNKDRPTTYAAPAVESPGGRTPKSTRHDNLNAIDEERQIDQDGFEL